MSLYWTLRANWDHFVLHTPVLNSLTREEYQSANRLLVANAPTLSPVLHIGCGVKSTLLELPQIPVFHVDSNRTMLLKSRQNLPANSHFLSGNTLSLPFRASSIGTVVAIGLSEYLPAPEKWLNEMDRILRSGGTLLFSTSPAIPKNRLRHLWSHSLYLRSSKDWEHLLKRHGFSVISIVKTTLQEQLLVRKTAS